MSFRAGTLLAALALATGCAAAGSSTGASAPVPLQLEDRQIIVALPLVTPAVLADTTRQIARYYEIEPIGAFPLRSIAAHCVVFRVPAGRSVDDVVAELRSFPGAETVQRNQSFEGLSPPHRDARATLQYGAAAIRADEAHRWTTGKDVLVAIIDTGVDEEHPDLRGRVAVRGSFVRGGDESFRRDAHGTALAGVIAARADGVGISGVAPDARLLAAKACREIGGPTGKARCSSWTIARAIDFALGKDARVINLSLAGPPDPLIARLIDAAGRQGAVVTAAAGDDPSAVGFPASLDGVIAVVASDVDGRVPPSTAGRSELLAAPGVEILTTMPGSGYGVLSGSSLSTAHVSGAIALLLERDPALEPSEASRLVLRTAQHRRADARVEEAIGILDVCAALRELTSGRECR